MVATVHSETTHRPTPWGPLLSPHRTLMAIAGLVLAKHSVDLPSATAIFLQETCLFTYVVVLS